MSQIIYYTCFFGLSIIFSLLYAFLWHKQFDVHMALLFILIPVMNLGYLLMYTGSEAGTVIALLKVVYIGGCASPWLITMCELKLCQIPVPRVFRIGSLLISTILFLIVLTIGYSDLFYKSLTVIRVGDVWIQKKVYGPFHLLHYIVISCYLLVDIVAIIYSYRKKKQVSRIILMLLFIPIPVTVTAYIASHALTAYGIELMPATYVFAQFVYLLIARRMVLYDVSEMVIESMVQSGDTGFISVDSRGRYLGSNETARKILPELEEMTVDKPFADCAELSGTAVEWLRRFRSDPQDCRMVYVQKAADPAGEERIYSVHVSDLYDGARKCGCQIFMQDDTANQKYIRLMDRYNHELHSEVEAKTARIESMHDRLILGMAAMVESRDNSTGGHIRRTSRGVQLLIEKMQEDGAMPLSEDFCKKIIKAAPMHDLGKIAVDDAVLRKPGRFTPQEFEVMKTHAAKGAGIVAEILKDTDDDEFRRIAENVAHYHHERMDGSGYPDGLKGEEIPLEARIMAIADVYDALVSKRVYKESFSFEKANGIILEGMGSQFDPALKKYYEAARPELEAFYLEEAGKAAQDALSA